MSSTLGIGVVGVNPRIRRTILSGIKSSRRAHVAGVVSRDPDKAADTAREFGGRPFSSLDAMIADSRVDVVFICTPFSLHHPMGLAALKAMKRVICEKPLASTAAEAAEMADLAAQVGSPNAVNFTYHSLPGQRLVAALVGDGQIGQLTHLSLSYWQARQRLPNAIPSDALMEVGSHEVDLALWWGQIGGMGQIVEVTADQVELNEGVASIISVLARTEQGGSVSIQANRVAAGWRNGMDCRLVGSEGTIVLTFDTDQAEIRMAKFGDGSPEGTFRVVPIPPELAVSYADFPSFHIDRLVGALEGEVAFPDFAYGLRCQNVLEAIRHATNDRRWVIVGSPPPATSQTERPSSESAALS